MQSKINSELSQLIFDTLSKDKLTLDKWGFANPTTSYEGFGLDFEINCSSKIGFVKVHYDYEVDKFYIYLLTQTHDFVALHSDIDLEEIVKSIDNELFI